MEQEARLSEKLGLDVATLLEEQRAADAGDALERMAALGAEIRTRREAGGAAPG